LNTSEIQKWLDTIDDEPEVDERELVAARSDADLSNGEFNGSNMDHDIVSEADGNSTNADPDADNMDVSDSDSENSEDCFIGKDKKTKWNKKEHVASAKTKCTKHCEKMPGPKLGAMGITEEIDTFLKFTDTAMINEIVNYQAIIIVTNNYVYCIFGYSSASYFQNLINSLL
jgi:hypothetical protein